MPPLINFMRCHFCSLVKCNMDAELDFALSHCDAIGFDVDHTIIRYRLRELYQLIFHAMAQCMVTHHDYPDHLLRATLDLSFWYACKTLVIECWLDASPRAAAQRASWWTLPRAIFSSWRTMGSCCGALRAGSPGAALVLTCCAARRAFHGTRQLAQDEVEAKYGRRPWQYFADLRAHRKSRA